MILIFQKWCSTETFFSANCTLYYKEVSAQKNFGTFSLHHICCKPSVTVASC